jgi:hypothetical protein
MKISGGDIIRVWEEFALVASCITDNCEPLSSVPGCVG